MQLIRLCRIQGSRGFNQTSRRVFCQRRKEARQRTCALPSSDRQCVTAIGAVQVDTLVGGLDTWAFRVSDKHDLLRGHRHLLRKMAMRSNCSTSTPYLKWKAGS